MMSQSPAQLDADQVNPSLTVDAEFRTLTDGRDLTTVFRLREEPELAAWLLGFVDTELARHGRTGVSPGIAPPPEALHEALLRGGIIRAATRADGGLALSLNKEQNIWLNVRVRLPEQPARITPIAIMDDPDTARWLLLQYIDTAAHPVGEVPLAAESHARLREIGVLVDATPPPEAYFPDPAAASDLGAELATAVECIGQAAKEHIPPSVRQRLGRQTPRLPPDTGLIWARDAGTGLMFPSILPPGVTVDAARAAAGGLAAEREACWASQRESARHSLRLKRYAILREIIPPAQRPMLRAYVGQLVDRGYFPALDDGQVRLRTAIHNEPTIASLHHGLAALMSDIAGERLLASYCYLGHYVGGAVLERHLDRPQCAYNLSIVFGMFGPGGEPEPWPIYLEFDGEPVAVELAVGDGVMYSGTEIYHWRDALPADQRAVICFFHFVPEDFDGALH